MHDDGRPGETTTELLSDLVSAGADRVVLSIPIDRGSAWRTVTAEALRADVVSLARGLVGSGLHVGDRIAVLATGSADTFVLDLAAGMIGAVIVPLAADSSQSDLLAVLDDAAVTAVVVDSAVDFARFDELHGDLASVEHVWQLGLGALDKLRDAGASSAGDPDPLDARATAVGADTVAVLLYDDPSEGVIDSTSLTHGDLVERARALAGALGEAVGADASTLVVRPATDVFARVLTVTGLVTGMRLGFRPAASTIEEASSAFRPTVLLADPAVFGEFETSARSRAAASGRTQSLEQALDLAVEYSEARDTDSGVTRGLRARYALTDALVYRGLRKSMGGNLRFGISVATETSLPSRLRHIMRTLDVRPLETLGLPETVGPATIERPGDPFGRPTGSVGAALRGVSVAVSETGAISLAGASILRSTGSDSLTLGIHGSLDEAGRLTISARDDVDDVTSLSA